MKRLPILIAVAALPWSGANAQASDEGAAGQGEPSGHEIRAASVGGGSPMTRAPESTAGDAAAWELAYYGGAIVRGTTATGNLGMMVGAHFGAIFDAAWQLGLAGAITVYEPEINGVSTRNARYLAMGYAGPEFGYRVRPEQDFNAGFRALVGFGGIGHYSGQDNDTYAGHDFFFAVEPGFDVGYNVTEMVRMGIGVSYRMGFDVELPGIHEGQEGWNTVANGFNVDFTIDANFL